MPTPGAFRQPALVRCLRDRERKSFSLERTGLPVAKQRWVAPACAPASALSARPRREPELLGALGSRGWVFCLNPLGWVFGRHSRGPSSPRMCRTQIKWQLDDPICRYTLSFKFEQE